jgi:hypothetical protein
MIPKSEEMLRGGEEYCKGEKAQQQESKKIIYINCSETLQTDLAHRNQTNF